MNDQVPIGATAVFKGQPDVEITEYKGLKRSGISVGFSAHIQTEFMKSVPSCKELCDECSYPPISALSRTHLELHTLQCPLLEHFNLVDKQQKSLKAQSFGAYALMAKRGRRRLKQHACRDVHLSLLKQRDFCKLSMQVYP